MKLPPRYVKYENAPPAGGIFPMKASRPPACARRGVTPANVDSVEPTTYMLPAPSTATSSALSNVSVPRYVENSRWRPVGSILAANPSGQMPPNSSQNPM